MPNNRNCNLDLLRILCMFMVVILHTLNWGGLVEGSLIPGHYNWYSGNILFTLSLQAVNCFVLISGYFLCTSKFKLKKLINIWTQAIFYSAVVAILVMTVFSSSFSIKEFMKSCVIFTMDRYWFVTDYLLLYITFPFLNIAIKGMNKKTHLLCCGVLISIFCVLSNIVYITDFSEVNGGYSYIWFCILYLVAAYIRLYVPTRIKYQKFMFPAFIFFSLCICGERFVAYFITPYIFGTVRLTSLFYGYNSIVSFLAAITLFQSFRGLTIESKKTTRLISFVAPLTFAVYLIHEQELFRPVLWDILNPDATATKYYMVGYVLLCAISIFIICCIIEFIRQFLFKKLKINNFINTTCDKVQNKFIAKFFN